MDDRTQISLPFPVKGITENSAYGTVPEGYALESLNVVGFDVLEGRLRGGKRPGTGRAIRNPVKTAGTPVLRMRQVTLDSAEFTDAAGFFDDPFFADGSGPTGGGSGGGWGFPRYDWDFDFDSTGPGGFGIHGIDAEYRRTTDSPVDEPLVALPVASEEPFNYSDGVLVGNGPTNPQRWFGNESTNYWRVESHVARTTFESTLPPRSAIAARLFGTDDGRYDAAYPFEMECQASIHVPASGYCRLEITMLFGEPDSQVVFALSSNGYDLSAGGHAAVYEIDGNPLRQVAVGLASGEAVRLRCAWNPYTRRAELWINDTKRVETPPLLLTAAKAAGTENRIYPYFGFHAENVSANPSLNSSGFSLDNIVVRGVLIEP
jgi:hypothetical protein